ncbi:Queuine tRNA-ribosyltransferase accessory subunit 2 [Schistosoma japonicum]|nr:Queuine tRNA-ribosyltransferase accessory subunit 2 [Schistosoma japonicum]
MVKFSIVFPLGEYIRLGKLSEYTNHLQINLHTPACLLYTRYGNVPFLPPDIYEEIEQLPEFSFASMGYVVERKFVLMKFGKGLAEFAGLRKRGVVLFQSDPTHLATVAAVGKSSIPVWTTGGRLQLSVKEYSMCSKIASPTAFQAPTDNETFLLDVNPTMKRVKNSVIRTSGYLKELVSEYTSNEELAKNQSLKQTSHIVQVFAHIPPHLPRFITQIWQPLDIALAARSGCDIFDGSLPYRLSRSGIGWIYKDWDETNALNVISDIKFIEFPLKESHKLHEKEQYLPIQMGCSCFTCLHHSRIYISHLHITQEMLAPMLLMIHNSHQCYRFFSDLRRSITVNKVDLFVTHASNWYFPPNLLTIDKTNEFKSTVNTDHDDV